jgi:arsenical pump membrane protein
LFVTVRSGHNEDYASRFRTALGAGTLVAVLCNLVNNLPLGLLAGSLATILCVVALRREGHGARAWKFLGLGCIAMPPALMASLAAFM